MSIVNHWISGISLDFLLGLNAGEDRGSEMLVKLCVGPGGGLWY